MTRFIFDKSKDLELDYKHEDGKVERMAVSRIVKAYADVMGIEFCYEPEGSYKMPRSIDTTINLEIVKQQGKHYLSIEGTLFELHDTSKQWNPNDTKHLWEGLEYLMHI